MVQTVIANMALQTNVSAMLALKAILIVAVSKSSHFLCRPATVSNVAPMPNVQWPLVILNVSVKKASLVLVSTNVSISTNVRHRLLVDKMHNVLTLLEDMTVDVNMAL